MIRQNNAKYNGIGNIRLSFIILQFDYFQIRISMKIEVTFNKSTRKEFREQCVKRLQKFVAEMRNKGRNLPEREDYQIDNSSENSSETKIKICQYIQSKMSKNLIRGKEAKQIEQSEKKKYTILTSIANKEKQNGLNQSRKTYKQEGCLSNQIVKSDQAFNILQMKENVNQILENLQRNAKTQIKKQNHLQENMETVNKKLDQILNYFEQQSRTSNEVKSIYESEQQLIESQNEQFYSKFDSLADKYEQIKLNSLHQSKKGSRESKELFSPSSTQESVTFRHH